MNKRLCCITVYISADPVECSSMVPKLSGNCTVMYFKKRGIHPTFIVVPEAPTNLGFRGDNKALSSADGSVHQ